MRAIPFMIGRLVIVPVLGLGTLLGWAPAAWAQGQGSPLGGCSRSFSLKYTGAAAGDSKAGSIAGAVQFECDGTWVFADVISWDERTVRARGDLLVLQDGLRVNADHMEMDRATRFGTFFEAYGTARLTDRDPDKNMFGSMEPEVMFRGEKIERIGPRTYRLTNGMFSTCMQPTPRWEMTGSSGTITLDDHAVMKNVQLRVKGVPVLYLPYLYYPLKKDDRATGLLIPSYSASGVRGQGLSNAFFWAINRSQDATLYYDWFTKSGQGAGADYRYVAAPGSQGDARFYTLNEKERLAADGTVERPAHRFYEVRGSFNQAVGRSFRLFGYTNYYSDQATQQLYQQNMFEQSRRDRNLSVTFTGNLTRRLRINALVQQHDIFNNDTVTRKGSLPQIDVWLSAKALGRSKVYFGAFGQAAYLDARPNLAQPQLDRNLWRFDGTSTVRAPLSPLPYLSVGTTASWRITNWQESLDPLTGSPVPVPITRNLIDVRADVVGPVVARVFQTPKSGYAERFKHVIEPRVGVQWLSPFDQRAQVIQIDPGIDQLVGGTTSMNYALVNRLYARVRSVDGGSQQREILAVTVGQSYYSNAAAAKVDPNYPSATVGTFSPMQISAAFSATDDVGGRFQMSIDSVVKAVRSYSASAVIQRPSLQLVAGWSKRQYLPGVPLFDNPINASHYLNANATMRILNGRVGGTYGFNYDLRQQGFLQQRIGGYYSAQCCGVSLDYQMVNISQFGLEGVQRDRRLAITFTLAGIGSFASPLGAFGR